MPSPLVPLALVGGFLFFLLSRDEEESPAVSPPGTPSGGTPAPSGGTPAPTPPPAGAPPPAGTTPATTDEWAFWKLDLSTGKWDFIGKNTIAGGPSNAQLLFGQMASQAAAQTQQQVTLYGIAPYGSPRPIYLYDTILQSWEELPDEPVDIYTVWSFDGGAWKPQQQVNERETAIMAYIEFARRLWEAAAQAQGQQANIPDIGLSRGSGTSANPTTIYDGVDWQPFTP